MSRWQGLDTVGQDRLCNLHTASELVDRWQRRINLYPHLLRNGGAAVADNDVQQYSLTSSGRMSAHTYGWAASMRSCSWAFVCFSAAMAAREAACVDRQLKYSAPKAISAAAIDTQVPPLTQGGYR
jgi:hypothetical protein